MKIIEELRNLHTEDNRKTSGYQDASDRFELLVERGLASKRIPIEIGRNDLMCKVYTYSNKKNRK